MTSLIRRIIEAAKAPFSPDDVDQVGPVQVQTIPNDSLIVEAELILKDHRRAHVQAVYNNFWNEISDPLVIIQTS